MIGTVRYRHRYCNTRAPAAAPAPAAAAAAAASGMYSTVIGLTSAVCPSTRTVRSVPLRL